MPGVQPSYPAPAAPMSFSTFHPPSSLYSETTSNGGLSGDGTGNTAGGEGPRFPCGSAPLTGPAFAGSTADSQDAAFAIVDVLLNMKDASFHLVYAKYSNEAKQLRENVKEAMKGDNIDPKEVESFRVWQTEVGAWGEKIDLEERATIRRDKRSRSQTGTRTLSGRLVVAALVTAVCSVVASSGKPSQ